MAFRLLKVVGGSALHSFQKTCPRSDCISTCVSLVVAGIKTHVADMEAQFSTGTLRVVAHFKMEQIPFFTGWTAALQYASERTMIVYSVTLRPLYGILQHQLNITSWITQSECPSTSAVALLLLRSANARGSCNPKLSTCAISTTTAAVKLQGTPAAVDTEQSSSKQQHCQHAQRVHNAHADTSQETSASLALMSLFLVWQVDATVVTEALEERA